MVMPIGDEILTVALKQWMEGVSSGPKKIATDVEETKRTMFVRDDT